MSEVTKGIGSSEHEQSRQKETRMMVSRVAVVVGLLLVMGRGPAWGQAACPCFTVAQAERWLQLATLTGARLCACNPFVDLGRTIASVVVKEAPDGCDGTDQTTTLALTVDSSLYLALPVCQVSTNGAEGL